MAIKFRALKFRCQNNCVVLIAIGVGIFWLKSVHPLELIAEFNWSKPD